MRSTRPDVRVVITGVGCVTSLGNGPAAIAQSLAQGRTAFCPSEALPGVAVCPVTDEGEDDAAARLGSWRHRRYLNRGARLAVLAGLRAAEAAGWDQRMPEETALIGAAGPMLDTGSEPGLPPGEPSDLDALWLLRWLPNTANAALARFLGIRGEGLVLSTACASALQAVGEGFLRVRHGLSRTVLVAAGDSRMSLGGLLGYAKASALAAGQDPRTAIRPFDASRSGFVPGEGGAAFVMETLESATRRNAPIAAEILGFGASLDGGNLTAPDPAGVAAERAVRQALDQSGVPTVDWVSAHGTGTRLNDAMEAHLLQRIFSDSDPRPAVTALKSWLGHGSAACGALELAVMLAASRAGILPGIRNLCDPLSPDMDISEANRPLPGPTGLLENFGFGGQNAALVVRVWT